MKNTLLKLLAFLSILSCGFTQPYVPAALLATMTKTYVPTALLGAIPALGKVPEINLGIGDRVDKVTESLDYAGGSLYYVAAVGKPALNNLSQSISDLVYKGFMSAGICAVGASVTACGLGIITHTILKDNAKKPRTKYAIGAGFAALGLATILGSNWITNKITQ